MSSQLPFILFIFFIQLCCSLAAPVDQIKSDVDPNDHSQDAMNDLGLEYGRYLQEVVQVLEDDKDFAKKLENVSAEHIKSGAIAQELNFVHHNIRSKLDELKRIELDRLRQLARKEHEIGGGSYSEDGRRWRSVGSTNKKLDEFIRKFDHIDHANPHSFEVQDLHKLIVKATRDLEEIDAKRKDEFKRYEMEKEYQYRESLKNMTEDQKKVAVEKHDEMVKKHKEHPRVHHPGSKQQLEEVWAEQDHMPKEEFNPKTFFKLHDVNSDGYWDQEEVEALLSLEIKKMYDPNNPEDDQNEMEEEYHRMREHIYKEADKNRDGLISLAEFIEFTQRADFERDEGWKGLDEQQVFNEDELRQFERKRQEYLAQQYGYGHGPPPHGYQQQPYMHYPPPPNPGPQYHVNQNFQQHPNQQGYYQAPPQFAVHPGNQYPPQHPNGQAPPNAQYYNQQPQQQQVMHQQAMQQQIAHHQAMQQQAFQQQQQHQQPQQPQIGKNPPVYHNSNPQANYGNVQPQGSMPPPAPQFGAPKAPNVGQQGNINLPPVQGQMPPSAPQASPQLNSNKQPPVYQPPNVHKT